MSFSHTETEAGMTGHWGQATLNSGLVKLSETIPCLGKHITCCALVVTAGLNGASNLKEIQIWRSRHQFFCIISLLMNTNIFKGTKNRLSRHHFFLCLINETTRC